MKLIEVLHPIITAFWLFQSSFLLGNLIISYYNSDIDNKVIPKILLRFLVSILTTAALYI